ncbi:GntR family transcriptional regulator [Sphaerisporangium sp. NPDC049002]|uniref:GntR family transcriptional regulator n=1 Tax=Sphaerisporangium sp. NPDC049002 TaxID=3155392 RepID=UPI0033F92FF7
MTVYEPVYRRVARILREEITAGKYQPGELLPSEGRLAQIHEVGKDTVRDALALLRSTGEVVTVRGVGTRVREEAEVTDEPVGKGTRIAARMPTEGEMHAMGLTPGTPVLVVERNGDVTVLPADRKALIVE